MNRGGPLSDLLGDDDIKRMEAVERLQGDNFIRLIDLLGLDRKVDLRHRDFSGVDFSDCDLRGCDFTGSDLRGTTGRNAIWDDTTILASADLDRSMFGPQPAKRENLTVRLPELGVEYNRIKRAYWSDQAIWAMDSLKGGIKNPIERQALAIALYFDATDQVVRNTILQYVLFSTGKEARLEFLNKIMTDVGTSADAIAGALQIFGRALRNDEEVVPVLLGIAEDPASSYGAVREAVQAALGNRYVLKHNGRAYRLVREIGDVGLENLYIRAFAGAVGVDHLTAVSEGRPRGGVNFKETIDAERIKGIALNIWRAKQTQEATVPKISWKPILGDIRGRDDIGPRVVQLLNELIQKGLPLNLDLTAA